MRSTIFALVALASSARAGFSDAGPFSCPANTNNECNSQQSSGWDWSTLNTGSSFSSYGGFAFSGFSCESSFGGGFKRDALTGRSFQVCNVLRSQLLLTYYRTNASLGLPLMMPIPPQALAVALINQFLLSPSPKSRSLLNSTVILSSTSPWGMVPLANRSHLALAGVQL